MNNFAEKRGCVKQQKRQKQQIALEFLIVFAFVMLIFTILFVLIANQRSLVINQQTFTEAQLIAQQVSAVINTAIQSGSGYASSTILTGFINSIPYSLYVSKSGLVLVNLTLGHQVIEAVAYVPAHSIVASNSMLVTGSNVLYSIPTYNSIMTVQNYLGHVCIDYNCGTSNNFASNITLTEQAVHAAAFSNVSSFISTPGYNALPTGSSARSVFAWVYFTGGISNYTVFSYGTAATGEMLDLRIHHRTLQVGTGASYYSSPLNISNNTWTFVGLAYAAGSSNVIVYANSSSSQFSVSGPLNTFGTTADIGAQAGCKCQNMKGYITNLQVYAYNLSKSQVQNQYSEGIGASPLTGNLVAWYPLQGNANDYSGYGNNGTAHGPVFYPSAVEFFAKAASFSMTPVENIPIGFVASSGSFTDSNTANARVYVNYTNSNGVATAFLTQTGNNGQALVTATAFNGNSSLTGNIAAFWPLNAQQGNRLYDISGNNANGAITYSSWSLPDYASFFDGSSAYVEIPTTSQLNSTTFTVSFWMNPRLYGNAQDNLTLPAASSSSSASVLVSHTYNSMWWMTFGDNNEMSMYVENSITPSQCCQSVIAYNAVPQLNKWYMVTGIANSTYIKIYINGMLVQEQPIIGSVQKAGNSIVVGTGFGAQATSYGYFSGQISNLQIYDTALTSAQVQELYNSGIAGSPVSASSLSGWWPLDGDAKDYSAYLNNGTVFGNLTNLNLGNLQSTNANYTSLLSASFNGVSDYSYISTNISQVSNALSVALWVNASSLSKMTSSDGYSIFNSVSSGSGNPVSFLLNNGGGLGTSAGSGDEELCISATCYNGYGISNSSWYFLAFTLNRGNASLYANGAPPYNISVLTGPYSINSLSLAKSALGISGFTGNMSNVQIYSKALSPQQIYRIYSSGISGIPVNYSSQNTNLVAWYPLQGNANDMSANMNSGIPSNVAYANTGFVNSHLVNTQGGYGINLNGNSSYAFTSTNVALGTNTMTAVAWVYPEQIRGTSGPIKIILSSKQAQNGGFVLAIQNGSSNNYFSANFSVYANAKWNKVTTPTALNPYDDWYQIAGVYNNSYMGIYINGVLMNKTALTGAINQPAGVTSIGGNNGNTTDYFAGAIADVQVYSVALTQQQLLQLYAYGMPPYARAIAQFSVIN